MTQNGFRREAFPPTVDSAPSQRAAEGIELSALLLRCGQADQQAFAELYDRTSARVFGLILRVLHDPGYAEETTQEVYLQVWRTATTFDPAKGSAVTWLMTLAHRRAVDRVRAEHAHTQREVAYGIRALGHEFDEVTEEVERRLEQQAVVAGLEKLTHTQREAISLAYYGGRTYSEVASYLGIGLPTVKSRIRDGLTRLKKSLGVT
ncbi:sigma-70 family RNA polymerase sigma factor [Nocardia camponoti]|uniref:ECF RNA polymerase sigma factor SigK n=1 Tax=Nocardia camponoti TaxID=1616106 RepID=A0A917QMJ9_9NOCA|nr:sigma-70 family RNA polymerase sigma factor [Nocardia camponoti]GGK56892.1 ECF RNA polymerase sigma factor SigK [Nocardia camponoti]